MFAERMKKTGSYRQLCYRECLHHALTQLGTKQSKLNTRYFVNVVRRRTLQAAVALCKTSKVKITASTSRAALLQRQQSCSSAEPRNVCICDPLITSVLPQSPIRCLTLKAESQKLRQGFFLNFRNFCFARSPLVITHAIATLTPTPPSASSTTTANPHFTPYQSLTF